MEKDVLKRDLFIEKKRLILIKIYYLIKENNIELVLPADYYNKIFEYINK